MHRLRLDTASLALALHPFDRRRRANLKPARRGSSQTASFDSVDNPVNKHAA